MKNAWIDGEPDVVDESVFTKGCQLGFHSWNGWSPEREFCEGAAEIVGQLDPEVIIETGVGQGFTTRRVHEALPENSTYLAFEADPRMYSQIPTGDFPAIQFCEGHPTAQDYESADLVIFDSLGKLRRGEMRLWASSAQKNSYILCHDADLSRPGTPHHRNAKLIQRLKLRGVWTPNPRGGFFGQR